MSNLATLIAAQDYTDLLINTCTIRRFTTSGAQGGHGQTLGSFADLATGVACRHEQTDGDEVVIDNEIVIVYVRLWLEAAQDITEKDEIVYDGDTYKAKLLDSPQDDTSVHHKAVALKWVKK